jgi:hypothetical protein
MLPEHDQNPQQSTCVQEMTLRHQTVGGRRHHDHFQMLEVNQRHSVTYRDDVASFVDEDLTRVVIWAFQPPQPVMHKCITQTLARTLCLWILTFHGLTLVQMLLVRAT